MPLGVTMPRVVHANNATREPAKQERQASEIEKEAARCLVAQRSTIHSGIGTSYREIAQKCLKYIEAYDYAKSIGVF